MFYIIYIIIPYKKYIYGNDTVYIWFIYVFINSVLKFRIFNKDLIFCDFIKTRCIRNLYGIFKKRIKSTECHVWKLYVILKRNKYTENFIKFIQNFLKMYKAFLMTDRIM